MVSRLVLLILVLGGACAARPIGNEPLRGRRALQQPEEPVSDPPAVGAAIPDQFIAILENNEDMSAQVTRLAEAVQEALTDDVTVEAASAGSGPSFEVISSIDTATPAAAAAVSAATAGAGSRGIQAIVIKADKKTINAIRTKVPKGIVKALIPDVMAFAAAASPNCLAAAAANMPAQPLDVKPTFAWTGCLSAQSKLLFYSRSCGSNKLQYNTMIAVDRSSGAIMLHRGKPCITYADPAKPAWTKHRFGSCGMAPVIAPTLPVRVCDDTPVTPPNSPPPSSSQPPVDPPPKGPKGKLPREKLAAGEEVPTGVARIEAVTSYGAVNTKGQQVGVAVADSGIDCSHPDINCAGSHSWVSDSADFPGDSAGDVDFYGHGTHVAGIIGAKNEGEGVVGVAPGLPVYSLKVLNGQGVGSTSSWLGAMGWMMNEGLAKGVRIINFSLTSYFDPAGPNYDSVIFKGLCEVFQQASDAGIIVTAAAGNSGANMRGFFPAICPSVLAVSAINAQGNGPSVISNWLPADSMTAEERASLIAAPGTGIKSTVPKRVVPSGYMSLSGTSMAAPHVAGIAANCLIAGDCSPNSKGIDNISVLQDQARQRYSVPPAYNFAGDATSTANNRYYGYLAWAAP